MSARSDQAAILCSTRQGRGIVASHAGTAVHSAAPWRPANLPQPCRAGRRKAGTACACQPLLVGSLPLGSHSTMKIREGLPHPRGANWDGKGVNFSLFSAHASKVELCLFDARGEKEIERIELPEYTDEIWHG